MTITSQLDRTLDSLFLERVHGAIALRGFKFQLLYSLYSAFGLLSETNSIERIQFEGIEDIDLVGFSLDNTFIQVKSSSNTKGWGWINSEKILDKFIDTYKVDNQAEFVLITNFEFTGELKTLENYLSGILSGMPSKLEKHLQVISSRNDLADAEMRTFLERLKFQTVSEDELIELIQAEIIQKLDVSGGAEELYFLSLFAKVLSVASEREAFTRVKFVNIKSQIEQGIASAKSNPAIEQGLLNKLQFKDEPNTSDYYEGVGARPAHILANLDAQRPQWIEEIDETLKNTPVTVIRASSGQGKSTLLYRYALTFYNNHCIYVLRNLRSPEQVEPVEQFLKSYVKLSVPLLVLIDDLLATRHQREIRSE